MKVRTLTGLRLYKLFKDTTFRTKHPQFKAAYGEVDASKRGCCGKKLKGKAYLVCADTVKRNPDVIKKYLGVDQVELFLGTPKRLVRL